MTTLTQKAIKEATGLECNKEQLAALKAEQKRIHFSLNAYEQHLKRRVERYGVLTMDEQNALNKKSTKATADEGESLAQQLKKQKLNGSSSKKANNKKQEENKRDEMLKKQADALKKAEAESKKENKKNNKKSTKALTFGEVVKRYAELEKKQAALLKELKAIESEMAEINAMTLK